MNPRCRYGYFARRPRSGARSTIAFCEEGVKLAPSVLRRLLAIVAMVFGFAVFVGPVSVASAAPAAAPASFSAPAAPASTTAGQDWWW
jgi:hypothetical protein